MSKYNPTFDDLGIDSHIVVCRKVNNDSYYDGDKLIIGSKYHWYDSYSESAKTYIGAFLGMNDHTYFDEDDGKLRFCYSYSILTENGEIEIPEYYTGKLLV